MHIAASGTFLSQLCCTCSLRPSLPPALYPPFISPSRCVLCGGYSSRGRYSPLFSDGGAPHLPNDDRSGGCAHRESRFPRSFFLSARDGPRRIGGNPSLYRRFPLALGAIRADRARRSTVAAKSANFNVPFDSPSALLEPHEFSCAPRDLADNGTAAAAAARAQFMSHKHNA